MSPTLVAEKRTVGRDLQSNLNVDRELTFRELRMQAEASANSIKGIMSLLGISPFEELRKLTAKLIDDASCFVQNKVEERMIAISEQVASAVKVGGGDAITVLDLAKQEVFGAKKRGIDTTPENLLSKPEFNNPAQEESGMTGLDLDDDKKRVIAETLEDGYKSFVRRLFAALDQWKHIGGDNSLALAQKTVLELDDLVKSAAIEIQDKVMDAIETITKNPTESLTRLDFIKITFLSDFFSEISRVASLPERDASGVYDGTIEDAIQAGGLKRVKNWAVSHGFRLQSDEDLAWTKERDKDARVITKPDLVVPLPLLPEGKTTFSSIGKGKLLGVHISQKDIYELIIPLNREASASNPVIGRSIPCPIGAKLVKISPERPAWALRSLDVEKRKMLVSVVQEDSDKPIHIQVDPDVTSDVIFSRDLSMCGVQNRSLESNDVIKLYTLKANGKLSSLASFKIPDVIRFSAICEYPNDLTFNGSDRLAWVGIDLDGKVYCARQSDRWKPVEMGSLPIDPKSKQYFRILDSESRIVVFQKDNYDSSWHVITCFPGVYVKNHKLYEVCDIDLQPSLGKQFSLFDISPDGTCISVKCRSDNSVRILRLTQSAEGQPLPVTSVIKLDDPSEDVLDVILTYDNKALLFVKNPRIGGTVLRVFNLNPETESLGQIVH